MLSARIFIIFFDPKLNENYFEEINNHLGRIESLLSCLSDGVLLFRMEPVTLTIGIDNGEWNRGGWWILTKISICMEIGIIMESATSSV